jgi:hypothetical protein
VCVEPYRSAVADLWPDEAAGHHLLLDLGGPVERETLPGHARSRRRARQRAAGAGEELAKPLRQVIESVNQTLKGQLDLEGQGGRTESGVLVRILYRVPALAAASWHNDQTGQDVKRSLIAYDH